MSSSCTSPCLHKAATHREGFSRKLTQTHPASYQRQTQPANPNPPISSGWFCLPSNTICLCLLNSGVGPPIPVPRSAELQQLPLSVANKKFCAAPQGKEMGQKIIFPSNWNKLRTGKWVGARMCRSLTESLYCSGCKQNGSVCYRLPGAAPGGLCFPGKEESLSNLH